MQKRIMQKRNRSWVNFEFMGRKETQNAQKRIVEFSRRETETQSLEICVRVVIN